MPGTPREVTEHALEIRAGSKLVKQRLRRFDEEKRKVIGEEVHKLLKAEFIKEVHHPEWRMKKQRQWGMAAEGRTKSKEGRNANGL
jgi:hypothetical protein